MKRPQLVPARGRLTETPVTGDWVGLDDGGAIAAVCERHGDDRPSRSGPITGGHVLAANVDLALVTEPLPDPKARRLERFAALAASGGVPTALVLTKTDLADDGWETAARLARRLGVADAVAISAVTGEGLGIVRRLLAPGHHRRPAGRVRHRQVDARQRAAGRGAPEDQRRPRERPARAPHDRHPRTARRCPAARS